MGLTRSIEILRDRVQGRIVETGDPDYDQIRALWNAMIDRKPALIAQCAGADDVPPDAMAFAHRDAKFVINVHGRWNDGTDDERCISRAREFFRASTPFASGGSYVNFMTEDEGDRVKAAYGGNLARLQEIKRRYDPENVFHVNQNVKP